MAWRASLAAAVVLAAGAAAAAEPMDYRLTPILEGAGLEALEVELRFAGDADGETRLQLPNHWAGAAELWKQVRDLQVTGAEAADDGPAARRLRHAPGAPITVRYRIVPAGPEAPGPDYEKARPIVRPDWFYAHGEGVFASVEGRDQAPATFAWGPAPAGWRTASDLDHLAGGRAASTDDIIESILIGGADLKVLARDVGGAPLRLAVRGDWPFAPEALADQVSRIVLASNAFWGEPAQPFLLTAAPLDGGVGGRISTNGTGRGDAFAVLSTTNVDLTKEPFFLGHEYQHVWIPRRIGGLPPQGEARHYWLGEGFVDHYASRALLRAGVWTLRDALAKDNEILARYAASSALRLTAEEIAAKFWKDSDATQAPYDRGRLLALVIDRRLRRAGSDLDAVMRAQLRQAGANRSEGRTVYATDLFADTVRRLAPGAAKEVEALIEAHVVRGEPIRLPPDAWGGCVEVRDETFGAFDRGFDGAASAERGVITGVDPQGPAYAAGLRDGMKRLGREGGREGDSRVPIGYRVADASGSERLITYLPAGRRQLPLQQLALKTGLGEADLAACTREVLEGPG